LTSHRIGSNVGLRFPTRQPFQKSADAVSPRRPYTELIRCALKGALDFFHAIMSLKVNPASSSAAVAR